MKGDALELANKMSEMENRLSDKIGTIATAVAGMKGEFGADILSLKSDVKDLQDENIREEWKDWLGRTAFGGGIIGVNLVIHKVANSLGWKI